MVAVRKCERALGTRWSANSHRDNGERRRRSTASSASRCTSRARRVSAESVLSFVAEVDGEVLVEVGTIGFEGIVRTSRVGGDRLPGSRGGACPVVSLRGERGTTAWWGEVPRVCSGQ